MTHVLGEAFKWGAGNTESTEDWGYLHINHHHCHHHHYYNHNQNYDHDNTTGDWRGELKRGRSRWRSNGGEGGRDQDAKQQLLRQKETHPNVTEGQFFLINSLKILNSSLTERSECETGFTCLTWPWIVFPAIQSHFFFLQVSHRKRPSTLMIDKKERLKRSSNVSTTPSTDSSKSSKTFEFFDYDEETKEKVFLDEAALTYY